MTDRLPSALARVKRPEYTGENRCLPCTIVNVGIALGVSALLAPVAIELGAAVLAGSLLAIYARGYLVPGTPALTERYLPDRVLARFEKGPAGTAPDAPADDGSPAERAAIDPESFLLEAGAVEPCPERDDLRLTDAFAERVDRRLERHRAAVGREAAAALFDAEPDDVTVTRGEHPEVRLDHRVRTWPSSAALLADVATHEALSDETRRWAAVPIEQRLQVLRSLRSFHERCPRCGGAVDVSADPVDSCCRSYEVVTVGCRDCGDPLLELDPTAVDADVIGADG